MALTESQLVAIIKAHRRNSLGVEDGELSNERADALDHYHGRPYGNEQEGRSQVVSRDLSEAVDWALPGILRVFVQSGSLGEFDPVGQEDEALAEQESDYVNLVIMKDNPGFIILHDWFKDALLLKNGYVKHYWDVTEKITEEEYQGVSLDELTLLMERLQADGAEVEVKAQEERQVTLMDPMAGNIPLTVYDVRLQIKRKEGRLRIEAVPTEEVRVSKRCRGSLQDSPFAEHVARKTRSDLIEMGMPKDFVYELSAATEDENDTEAVKRDSVNDESDDELGTSYDRSMDEIEFCEAYLKVDFDGDGVAELRKVVTVADKIPPGDEWNEVIDSVPITGCVPKRVPHRHVGESLDDELSDLQEIKTALMRQLLDNIYLTNNQQWLVNERVNISDFLQSLPGGIKRVQGREPVTGAAEPVITQPILNQILPAIDYVDGVKENRTGISKATTGLDPDILKQTTKGAFLENLNKASQKIEMIARMLAETGVKELVLRVHELLMKHQDKARIVRLRGKYVPINPQEWRERTDLTVRVGLGTGSEEEKREKLLLLASLQERIAQLGLVGPQQAFALFADVAKTLGFDMPEKYALQPDSPEYQQAMQSRGQGQPNPLAEAEQIKGQFRMQEKQAEFQLKAGLEQMKMQHEHQMQMMRMELEASARERDRQSREAIEVMKAEIQAFLQNKQLDLGQAGMAAGVQGV